MSTEPETSRWKVYRRHGNEKRDPLRGPVKLNLRLRSDRIEYRGLNGVGDITCDLSRSGTHQSVVPSPVNIESIHYTSITRGKLNHNTARYDVLQGSRLDL